MMGEIPHVEINGRLLHFDGGKCRSKCLIYLAMCNHCLKFYIGKTIQELRCKISGHRSFTKSFNRNEEVSDENCLAAHLTSMHGVIDSKGFNSSYKFSIIEHVSSPGSLLTREQLHINSYKTFSPFGLNIANPIGLKAKLVS